MYSVHISTVHCTVYNIYSAHDILAVVELIDEVNIRTSGVVGAGLEPAPRGVHCLDSVRQSGQHTLQQFGGTLGLALNRDKVTSLTYTKEGEERSTGNFWTMSTFYVLSVKASLCEAISDL